MGVLSHSISVLDNVLRYGILVDPIRWVRYIQHDPAIWPPLYLLMGLNVNILCSLIVEKLLAQDNAWQGVGRSALCFNLSLTLAAPCLVVFVWECNPVAAGMVMCLVTMTFLKLVSYHMARQKARAPKGERQLASHPEQMNEVVEAPQDTTTRVVENTRLAVLLDHNRTRQLKLARDLGSPKTRPDWKRALSFSSYGLCNRGNRHLPPQFAEGAVTSPLGCPLPFAQSAPKLPKQQPTKLEHQRKAARRDSPSGVKWGEVVAPLAASK
ncbi:hypothetical protein HPB47_002226 [Ixodes persulcatus]|uniref:Uncharacterized protein n=1 Tax=Ixodes persulcatus TaxID=34615 RepID=A0AC60PLV1_IXOPE|nr:hypothetical protein HPB47_002226 [Ixodes persulcatus]